MAISTDQSSLQRITREFASLRELVAVSIRDAILDGRLKPGQKLIEKDLCSSLGISRSLLREALPKLQAEGLITSVAHKGPSVAQIDADEVKEIYQIRQVVEALAAREFARNATDVQVKELRKQLVTLKRPAAAGNLRDLLVAKAGFYSVLFAGCGNKMISTVVTQLNNRIVLYKRLSLSVPGRAKEVVDELEDVVSAIEARDAERAGKSCEAHVVNAQRTVLLRLADESSVASPRARVARVAKGAGLAKSARSGKKK